MLNLMFEGRSLDSAYQNAMLFKPVIRVVMKCLLPLSSNLAVRELGFVPARVVKVGQEDDGGALADFALLVTRSRAETKLEGFFSQVKLRSGHGARNVRGVRADEGVQGASPEVAFLVGQVIRQSLEGRFGTVNRKVLGISAVAVFVAIRGGVIPNAVA